MEADGTLSGDDKHKSRISSLLKFCVKWFGVIAVCFILVLLFVGFFFFTNFHNNSAIAWQWPWVLLAFATGGFLMFDPVLAFIEGLGKVQDIARMRMVQQSVYVFSVITFLVSGFDLYSSAIATMFSFLSIATMVLFSDKYKMLKHVWQLHGEWRINYKEEIFPYQWRIALSWISGYFIFQLFNPVLFASEGPVVAGQMGITLAALNGIVGLSMSWINTKVSLFSGLIARKKYEELDLVFFKSFGQSLFITACGVCFLYLLVQFLQRSDIQIGYRFLASFPLAFMCLSYLFNNVCFGLATYLRCHKQEPLLIQSVVFAILSCISTLVIWKILWFVWNNSWILIACGYSWCPMGIHHFQVKRKEWHST